MNDSLIFIALHSPTSLVRFLPSALGWWQRMIYHYHSLMNSESENF